MTRLYPFLSESFGTKLSVEQTKELIKTKCANNYNIMKKAKKWIYRGDDTLNNPFILADSRKAERESANTSNHYTLLLSKYLDSWKSYPPRNKSFICSTASYTAEDYGKCYHIIPFDNTQVAICPNFDLWESFAWGLKQINADTNNKGVKFYNSTETRKIQNLSDFNSFLNDTLNIDIHNLAQKLFYKLFEFKSVFPSKYRHKTLIEYLNMHLDPVKNKFELTPNISNVISKKNREVWFSGECILIERDSDEERVLFNF